MNYKWIISSKPQLLFSVDLFYDVSSLKLCSVRNWLNEMSFDSFFSNYFDQMMTPTPSEFFDSFKKFQIFKCQIQQAQKSISQRSLWSTINFFESAYKTCCRTAKNPTLFKLSKIVKFKDFKPKFLRNLNMKPKIS